MTKKKEEKIKKKKKKFVFSFKKKKKKKKNIKKKNLQMRKNNVKKKKKKSWKENNFKAPCDDWISKLIMKKVKSYSNETTVIKIISNKTENIFFKCILKIVEINVRLFPSCLWKKNIRQKMVPGFDFVHKTNTIKIWF